MTGRLVQALFVVSLAGGLAVFAACQSSSTSVVGPSGVKCAISVPSTLPSIGASGGTATVNVATASECVWSASSSADWISITSSSRGQGPGVVQIAAASNPTPSPRQGAVLVGEVRIELSQSGAQCHYQLTPSSGRVGASGGRGVVDIATLDGCQWSATASASWLSVVDGAGSGSGRVEYTASANDGPGRTGVISIAGQAFTVRQSSVNADPNAPETPGAPNPPGTPEQPGTPEFPGTPEPPNPPGTPPCEFHISGTQLSSGAAGETATVGVSAASHCNWTAASQVDWIAVTNGGSGSGDGAVTLVVSKNDGPARSGTVLIAGQTYTVTQAAAPVVCSYNLSVSGHSASAAAGTVSVDVATQSGCEWTASSQTSWITVQSGAAGNGSGSVLLSIASNQGAERTATISIAGKPFVVTQSAAACVYKLSPAAQNVALLGGGPFSVDVDTQDWCGWTASTSETWISLRGPTSGTGRATVTYHVDLLLLGSRSGTIRIANQNVTVNQNGLLGVAP